ncbi:hypothetical protein Tco_0667541 [Tanacetum coccineum]
MKAPIDTTLADSIGIVEPFQASFVLAMSVMDRSSLKRVSVIRALKKASPKIEGFDLKNSQSCRSVKRASVARANEKASSKVLGFDLRSAHCRAGLSPDI